LTDPEKTEAIQLLSQSLAPVWRGIAKTPGVCGDSACIAKTRIPVRVMIQALRLGATESELLYDYPTLSAADLVNAWAYAQGQSPEEIITQAVTLYLKSQMQFSTPPETQPLSIEKRRAFLKLPMVERRQIL
jgi:uncharacterized protein (DUF433 family)